MISTEEHNRMRWAARRGMLELDLVLEPFVRLRYAHLDDAGRQLFQRLLTCEDQDLFAWLLQRETPEEEGLAAIVEQILQFARTPSEDK